MLLSVNTVHVSDVGDSSQSGSSPSLCLSFGREERELGQVHGTELRDAAMQGDGEGVYLRKSLRASFNSLSPCLLLPLPPSVLYPMTEAHRFLCC